MIFIVNESAYNGKAKLDVQYMRVEGSFFLVIYFFLILLKSRSVDVSKM